MAYALVTSGSGGSSDGNGFTTGAINTTGANLIVVFLGTGITNTGTVSDSKSNTWTALTKVGTSVYDDRWGQLFYCENPTVGTGHTFSVSGTGNNPCLAILAFSGGTTSSFDQENGNGGAFPPGTSVSTGSITPGFDNEVLVAALLFDDNNTPTVDSGFTIAQTVPSVVFGRHGVQLAYLIETTATAKNPTFSWPVSQRAVAVIASFKASGAAPSAVLDKPRRRFLRR